MAMRRVSDVFKAQGLVCYLTWKYPNIKPRVEVVVDEQSKRVALDIYMGNSLVAQFKRLTPAMAEVHWLDLVYVNYVFVNEALFRDMSYDNKWWGTAVVLRVERLAAAKRQIKEGSYRNNIAIIGGNKCTPYQL